MTKGDVFVEISKTVDKTIRYIQEVLYKTDGLSLMILDRYKSVLTNFTKDKSLHTLLKFREIYHRASREGEDTDYTEATSLNFEGEYTSLNDLFEKIEELVSEYNEFS